MDDGRCPGSDILFANLEKEHQVSRVINSNRTRIRISRHVKGLDSNPSLTNDIEVA